MSEHVLDNPNLIIYIKTYNILRIKPENSLQAFLDSQSKTSKEPPAEDSDSK